MAKEFDRDKLWAWRKAAQTGFLRRAQSEASPEQRVGAGESKAERSVSENAPSQGEANDRDRYRSRLSARYHLDSEYLSVSQLALILGMSTSAIHDDMRAGRFFLPFCLFDAAPKIFIDDLVEWHCSGRCVAPAFGGESWQPACVDSDDARKESEDESARSDDEAHVKSDRHSNAFLRLTGIDPCALCDQGRQL